MCEQINEKNITIDFAFFSNQICSIEYVYEIRKQLSHNLTAIAEIEALSKIDNKNDETKNKILRLISSLEVTTKDIKICTQKVEDAISLHNGAISSNIFDTIEANIIPLISSVKANLDLLILIGYLKKLTSEYKKLDEYLKLLSKNINQPYFERSIKTLKKEHNCYIGKHILLFILLLLSGIFLFFFTKNQCETTIQITKKDHVCNCCGTKSNNCKCKLCCAYPNCHMFGFTSDSICGNHYKCRSNNCICCSSDNKCLYEICETNSKHSLCEWQKFVIFVWIIILVYIIVWCIFRLPSLYRKNKRIDAIITKINTGYYRSIEEFRRDLDSALKQ